MPHFLAARPKAVAQRGRVVAPLVGVLALVLALVAMTASAGATVRHNTKPPGDKPAQKHDDAAGQPGNKDKDQGQPDKDKNQGQAKDEDKNQGKPKDEDKNQGKPKDDQDKDHEAGCDSSGPGNPCHPQQQCGENSGPGNANDTCPAGNPECPGANEGQGNADDHHADKVKGARDKAAKTGHKVKQHKNKKAGEDEDDDDAANCPPLPCPNGQARDAQGNCPAPPCPNGRPRDAQGNCPVATNTVAGTQVTQTPGTTPVPSNTVAGTQARSATARLQTQSRCGTRAFRVTISGRNIRRVTLFVAGRRVRTITVPAGRRSITVSVPVRRFGARRQSVRARVTFRNGAPARTLTASATRCAQTSVSPQFTG